MKGVIKMDYIDKMIKKRVESEDWTIPQSLDNTIDCVLNDLPQRKVYKRTPLKLLVPAALIIILTTTTVLAAGLPTVKDSINSVISFFQGKSDTRYASDKQNFEKFNNAVGLSAEDKGIKVTVDNIAVDDNFLNIFYTIESNKPLAKKDTDQYNNPITWFPDFNYKINGKQVITINGKPTLKVLNNNAIDAYFESEYKLKGMMRLNISGETLKDNFLLEISTNWLPDAKGNWTISTTVDKNQTKAATKTVYPNRAATIKLDDTHKITIDKVSISPFGSQILISERIHRGQHIFSDFALFDDKGNSLDVLDLSLMEQANVKNTNAFEFIKTNKDMKYITLVPMKIDNAYRSLPDPVGDINKLPIILKRNPTCNIVVENIVFTQNQMKIKYHIEGFNRAVIYFDFYDKNGNEIDFRDISRELFIDRVSGKYTEKYTSLKTNFDFSKISKILLHAKPKFDLLYDQQIRIDLNK